MRADRLLALLMLLQTRGRMTAQELAGELEISERTVYRDIDALCAAGVPVYCERGPGGGCALLESYRTNLTGLKADEVRALFMLSIPEPLTQLGVSQELRAAMLKLAAALPGSQRNQEAQARQRIYLDSTPWYDKTKSMPHLQTCKQAVWQDRQLDIVQRMWFGDIERRVSPYGLVAKTNIWYLIAEYKGHIHAYPLADIVSATLTNETFERPADFALPAFWNAHCAEIEKGHATFEVTLRIAPVLRRTLLADFGQELRDQLLSARPDAAGWVTVRLNFESFEAARERILGFGSAGEVIEPQALRLSVADYAEQILKRYRN